MKFTCLLFFLAVLISGSVGLKILGVLPFSGSSHFAIGNGIIKSLHEAGHDVTVISPFPRKTPIPRHRDVSLADFLEQFKKEKQTNMFDFHGMNPFMMLMFMYKMMGNDLTQMILNNKNIKSFLESNEKFDVCIVETFNIDAILGIADRADCILITFTTFGAVKWVNDMTGNQMPSSYVPQPFLHYTDKMTFPERFHNTLINFLEDIGFEFHRMNQRRLYNKYFPNAKRSFDEIYKSSSLVFINQHVSSGSPRPLLPNMIEIGGIHVEPVKPLPKDFQEFLDSAKDGVILFSMGSVIQAVDWPIEKREILIKAFGKLKQKVIWKYENETLPNKPDNVMISKWIPQRDIVAHPNVKVFITHGGLLGTTEALIEGKPVLGFPVFGDQQMNMAKAVERGYGLSIDLSKLDEVSVTSALKELLENPKYLENAKSISSRFNDRPMTPKESVVFWTEHVARHKGADYLQAESKNMNFFVFHSIDSYSIIGVAVLILLYIDYLILKCLLSCICKKKQPIDVKKKKK